MRIRYVLFNAYATGGTIRTVINQAHSLCADHDVEIASVYRHRETPTFQIDPRVRLVPLTDLRSDGSRRSDPAKTSSRFLSRTRRWQNPFPHQFDHRFSRWDPEVDFRLLRYFRAEDDGILVTTRPGLNLMAARMAPRRLVRVAQDHMNLGTYKPVLRQAIGRAYRNLDAVTVLTSRDREDYQRILADSKVRLECIPNGVPPTRQPPAALDAKVLVAAGRLEPQKGFDLLLDAFALVSADHPDWQLNIFGTGAMKSKLQDRIHRLGLAGKAHLKGQTTQLDEQLAGASAYVLSSRFEGLPMVLLESMMVGLPAVAFDCPTGPGEIIEHGRSGLLAPAKDVPALAACIREVIENPEARRAMGAAALQESVRYSSTAVRLMWERLFTELMAARR